MLRPATMIALLRYCRLGGLAEPAGGQRGPHPRIRPNGPAGGAALLLGASLLLGGAPVARASGCTVTKDMNGNVTSTDCLIFTFTDSYDENGNYTSTITPSGKLGNFPLGHVDDNRNRNYDYLHINNTLGQNIKGFVIHSSLAHNSGKRKEIRTLGDISINNVVPGSITKEQLTYSGYTRVGGDSDLYDHAVSFSKESARSFIRVNTLKARDYPGAIFAFHEDNLDTNTKTLTYGDGQIVQFKGNLKSILNDNDFDINIKFAWTSTGTADKTITFKTATRPDAPKDFTATAGIGQVVLNWTAAPTIPSGSTKQTIKKYQIRQKAGTGNFGNWGDIDPSSATTTSHTVTGLTDGTAYSFQIRAVSDNGNGDVSEEATATPIPSPAKPTGFKANPGDGQVTLTWNNPNNSTISRYEIAEKVGTGGTFGNWETIDSSNATTTSHTVQNLTNGTEYAYKIRAVNLTGIGAESDAKTATPILPAPTEFVAIEGNGKVTLSWKDPSIDTIERYELRYGAGDSVPQGEEWAPIANSGAATITHNVESLVNNTKYAFEIRVVGAGGTSLASQTVTATPNVGPGQPQNFKLTPSGETKPGQRYGGQVKLTWMDPLPGGIAVGSWEFLARTGSYQSSTDSIEWGEWGDDWTPIPAADITTTDGTHEYTHKNLTNKTPRQYRIRGLSAGGSPGIFAEAPGVTPHEYPSKPNSFTVRPGDGSVTLSWDIPPNIPNIVATTYEYKQSENDPNNFGAWQPIPGGRNAREHDVTGLTNTRTYYFKIRAHTEAYEGEESNVKSTTPNFAPAKPELVSLVPGDKTVKLVWTYTATDNDPTVGKVASWEYQQRERTASDSESAWDGWTLWREIDSSDKGTRETTVTDLTNARDHEFQVRAVTAGHVVGPASAAGSARPAAPPAKPTDFEAVPGEKQVTLTWTDPVNPDINEYQYCQKTDGTTCKDSDQNSDWKKMNITENVATTTTYTVTGLDNLNKDDPGYTFKIRAMTVGGVGPESEASNAVRPEKDDSPMFSSRDIDGKIFGYENGLPAAEIELPDATGGNGTLTYTFDPPLLSSDGLTCPIDTDADKTFCTKIIVTPTTEFKKTYTLTVKDADDKTDNDTDSLTFTIEVFDKPTVTLELDPKSISENGGEATVKATLNHASQYETKVSINIAPDPATADFFELTGATELTIDAGKEESTDTVTITAKDNAVHEAAKSVTISATATYNSQPIDKPADVTLTVTDDDAPTLILKLDPTEISENGGVTTVTASLDKAATSDTTVTIDATPVAPAVAGDFTLSENTKLTIKGGTTTSTGTVTITAVDNDVSQKENKTITISAEVATADTDLGLDAPDSVNLTIIEDDTVAMEERRETATKVLTEVARATLSGANAVIGQRFDAAPGGPAALSVADWQVGDTLAANTSLWERLERWDGDLTMVNRLADLSEGVDLLTQTNFSLPLNSARGGTWSIWGRGDWRGFEGTTDMGDYDGSQRAGYLGVDKWLNERLMAGLALSHSTSETDYTIEDEGGRIDTSLTSIWPYLQNTMDNGAQLRLVLGIGKGEVEHYPTGEADEKTDLTMRAVSLAGKLPVAQPGDFTLSATAAASLADMKTEGLASVAAINGLHVSSWNLRAGLEAKHEGFPVSDTQWTLTPRVALALRQDGGDGVTGTGAELSGGLRLAAPDSRFALDASGYWLALHSQDGTKEWGASVEARFSPGEGGEGLSLSVEPAWGVPYQAGVLASEDLFEEERRVNNLGRLSLTAHAGYGFALPSGLLTPFAEFTLPGEAEATRYAAGLNFAAPGGLDAKLSGERQDDDTRVGIDLSVEF